MTARLDMTARLNFDDEAGPLLVPPFEKRKGPLKAADFFCGIGGFHVAARNTGVDVVWACDIDAEARRAYRANFDLDPEGDIREIAPVDLPDYDLLFAGFPCQPFSIIGSKRGFADPRGTLFFELLRFIREHRPQAIILENVKQLVSTQKGAVLKRIVADLESLGYTVDYRVLNALNFGLPQKRERTLIVATQKKENFSWPIGNIPMMPLAEVLEDDPPKKHCVSETIRLSRQQAHTPKVKPAIWHENKAGNVSSHPWSCALRAGASYNYLLVDGERRLTPREMLRLQGFPDDYKIVCSDAQIRKQAGNAVPVPVVETVMKSLVETFDRTPTTRESTAT